MKQLFIFNVDNVIDIITNSSSELFILNGESTEIVKEMVANVYPGYLSEYEEVTSLRDASTEQIDTYISWVAEPWHMRDGYYKMSDKERRDYEIEDAKKKAAKYNMEPEVFFTNWDNAFDYSKSWWSANISEAGLKHIAKTLDPNGNIFLLFSIDDNPNFEYQEELENIARRYHLG